MNYLKIPTECPYCGSPTKILTSSSGVLNLVCENNQCSGRFNNRVDHYAGRKGLEIKGMSTKTIDKLIELGWLNNIKDIYNLKQYRNEWIKQPGFGQVSVDKILKAIENSKENVNLASFICALGIPLVGIRASKEIVKYYPTWDDFMAAIGGDWTELEGFGPEIDRSLNNFDYAEACEIAKMLEFTTPKTQPNNSSNPAAANLTFCITGKLTEFFKNRNELKDYIESIGGRVVNTISKKVNYLITNTPNSGTRKNQDAQKLGIKIITEAEFIEAFGQKS